MKCKERVGAGLGVGESRSEDVAQTGGWNPPTRFIAWGTVWNTGLPRGRVGLAKAKRAGGQDTSFPRCGGGGGDEGQGYGCSEQGLCKGGRSG